MNMRVLLSCIHLFDRLSIVVPVLEEHGIDFNVATVRGQQLSETDLLPIIGEYDGILAGDDELTSRVIEKASRLKVIAKWGVGIDSIDIESATQRGITVVNTPGVFGDEIADYALGYLLLLLRCQHRIDAAVRQGEWLKARGRSAAGLTIGIVGFGSSGQELAVRARALKMDVLVNDVIELSHDQILHSGATPVSLGELLAGSDVVSLHAPLTDSTFHLIDQAAIERMRPGVLLINTSRGRLVDTDALIGGLESGQIGGAALDVFEQEPLAAGHPLMAFENVLLGSHNASNTREAGDRTTRMAVENLVRHLGAA